MIDAVLVNGAVGAGESTVAEAISTLEGAAGGTHALIHVDAVRGLRPPPDDDRFQHELELENLRDLAANHRRAGATRFVLAGVIESAAELPRHRAALGVAGLLVCRLTVRAQVAAARLRCGTPTTRKACSGTSRGPWSCPPSSTGPASATRCSTPPTVLRSCSRGACARRPAGESLRRDETGELTPQGSATS